MAGDKTGVNAQAPIIQTNIKRGQQTVSLSTQDMFNRIINLRFIHKPKVAGAIPKTWTIRSDYEVFYWPGGFQYIPTRQKAAIKVTIKFVANRTAVSISVEVQNLFIKNPTDLETTDEPLQQLEIQMGYITQMPNWVNDQGYMNLPLSQFFALFDGTQPFNKPAFTPPTKLVAQVLATERKSMSPDGVTVFTCTIGTMSEPLSWAYNPAMLQTEAKKQSSAHWLTREPANSLPSIFFLLITRRFIRSNVKHDVSTKEQNFPTSNNFVQVENKRVQTVTIYGDDLLPISTLTLDNGRLSSADADTYGTIIYMSDMLWNMPLTEGPQWNLNGTEKAQAVPVDHPITTELYDNLQSQCNAIQQDFPFIRFYALGDGNLYAYHVQEAKEDFFSSTFVMQNQSQNNHIVKLPAVYDITWGGTRTIRMPFFSGILPMMTVAFQARYALNDLTGNFYMPPPGHVFFLVLLMDIVFGTVEDADNEMVMMCTDIDGPALPTTDQYGNIIPVPAKPPAAPASRTKFWKQMSLPVVDKYDGDDFTTDTSWATIINRLIVSARFNADAWGGTPPSNAQAIADLASWNPGLFGSVRIAGNLSPESNVYGTPLSLLYSATYNPINPGVADTVVINMPYLPAAKYTAEGKLG
jgi:hypothetical protein